MVKVIYLTYSKTLDEWKRRVSFFDSRRDAHHYLLKVFPGGHKVKRVIQKSETRGEKGGSLPRSGS